jgi:hypothetical protein
MPEPHLRASDADRAAVADVLGAHMSAGRLTVAEYDDRLARTYAARTYGELAELTADLPAQPTGRAPAVDPAAGGSGAHPAPVACGGSPWARGWGGGAPLRVIWGSWLSTAVIVVTIWAITCLTSNQWLYPWPIWVIGPWGAFLLTQTLTGGPGRGRGRDRHRDRQLDGRGR